MGREELKGVRERETSGLIELCGNAVGNEKDRFPVHSRVAMRREPMTGKKSGLAIEV